MYFGVSKPTLYDDIDFIYFYVISERVIVRFWLCILKCVLLIDINVKIKNVKVIGENKCDCNTKEVCKVSYYKEHNKQHKMQMANLGKIFISYMMRNNLVAFRDNEFL